MFDNDGETKSATYKMMLERYRSGYQGAANLDWWGRFFRRYVTGILALATAVIVFVTLADRQEEFAVAVMAGGVVFSLLGYITGRWLALLSSFMRAPLDTAVFTSPGLTDDEKLAIVSETGHSLSGKSRG